MVYGGLYGVVSSVFVDEVLGDEWFVYEFVPGGVEVVDFLEKMAFWHDICDLLI